MRSSKPGKTGRSLEEVLVMRKLKQASASTEWPEGTMKLPSLSMSASMPVGELLRHYGGGQQQQQHESGSSDNELIIKNLKEYCRALQGKVKTLETNLDGTVKAMQRELDETRKMANEKLEGQQRMIVKAMDEAHHAKAQLVQLARREEKWIQHHVNPGLTAGSTVLHAASVATDSSNTLVALGLGNLAPPKTPLEMVAINREERRRRADVAAAKQSAAAKASTLQSISNHMTELDMKVLHLKELFRHGDPLLERRLSATRIVAAARGFLQRRRTAAFQKGLREWKWARCKQVIWLMDMRVASKKQVTQKLEQVTMVRDVRILYKVYHKWVYMCKLTRPVRQQMYRRAHELGRAKDMLLLKRVFEALALVTVGGKSTKRANAARAELIQAIREELSAALIAKGEIGVVPVEEIERVLYKRVLLEFLERKRLLTMRNIWLNGLLKNAMWARANMKRANQQWTRVRAGRCFYAWTDWAYMVNAGLDRKRGSGPRRYEVRYNQKRIDQFARLRLKRYIFGPWRDYFRVQFSVRKCYQRSLARVVKATFAAWKGRTRVTRAMRIDAVDNWRGYSRLMTQLPFRAWASFVGGIKNRSAEQQRMVNSYLRWKWRQRINVIMKRWRHQALYGRLDGLYSRQMLITSLNEQKIMAAGLEKTLAAQTVEMDELREMTEKEIAKRKALEGRLAESVAEMHKQKMFFHHAEQELRRNEAIVESMATLNPRQIEHIKMLQPAFKFKTRKVHLPIDAGSDAAALSSGGDEAAAAQTGAEAGQGLGLEVGEEERLSRPPTAPQPSLQPQAQQKPQPQEQQGQQQHGGSEGRGGGAESPMASRPSSRLDSQSAHPSGPQGTPGAPPPSAGEAFAGTIVSFDAGASFGYGGFGLSQEDLILLDRVRWLVERFSVQPPKPVSVPTLTPAEEVRTLVETVVQVAPAVAVKPVENTDASSKKGRRKRGGDGDSDEESETTKGSSADSASAASVPASSEPQTKIVTTTAITWTPGAVTIPVRPPILPSSVPWVPPSDEPPTDLDPASDPASASASGSSSGSAPATGTNEAAASASTSASAGPYASVPPTEPKESGGAEPTSISTSSGAPGPEGSIDPAAPPAPVPEPAPVFVPDMTGKMFLGVMDFLVSGASRPSVFVLFFFCQSLISPFSLLPRTLENLQAMCRASPLKTSGTGSRLSWARGRDWWASPSPRRLPY